MRDFGFFISFIDYLCYKNSYKSGISQKYLLENMKIALECDNENLSFMIFYILVGSLGIVIPEIKESYSDVSFSFSWIILHISLSIGIINVSIHPEYSDADFSFDK